jgi:hypothetical protein
MPGPHHRDAEQEIAGSSEAHQHEPTLTSSAFFAFQRREMIPECLTGSRCFRRHVETLVAVALWQGGIALRAACPMIAARDVLLGASIRRGLHIAECPTVARSTHAFTVRPREVKVAITFALKAAAVRTTLYRAAGVFIAACPSPPCAHIRALNLSVAVRVHARHTGHTDWFKELRWRCTKPSQTLPGESYIK